MTKTCRQAVRDKGGRFVKGQSGNPKGDNQYTSLVPLIEALKKAGQKRGEDFWDMVAARVWTNDAVLVAVLKKIVPDKIEHSDKPPLTQKEVDAKYNRLRDYYQKQSRN